MKNILLIVLLTLGLRSFSQNCYTIVPSYTAPSCPTCCDGSITFNIVGGTPCGPYGYTLQPIGISPIGSWSNLCAGSYTIQYKDGGCCFLATCQVILAPGSTDIIESINGDFKFNLFPNPSSKALFISTNKIFEGDSEVEILNSLGQIVLKLKYKNEIDVSQLSSGHYTLKIITPEKHQFYSKFIKE